MLNDERCMERSGARAAREHGIVDPCVSSHKCPAAELVASKYHSSAPHRTCRIMHQLEHQAPAATHTARGLVAMHLSLSPPPSPLPRSKHPTQWQTPDGYHTTEVFESRMTLQDAERAAK